MNILLCVLRCLMSQDYEEEMKNDLIYGPVSHLKSMRLDEENKECLMPPGRSRKPNRK